MGLRLLEGVDRDVVEPEAGERVGDVEVERLESFVDERVVRVVDEEP